MPKTHIQITSPISYRIPEAAAAVGVSEWTLNEALKRGDITRRYPDSRPLIGHDDLVAWFESLPVDKPGSAA